MFLATEGLTAEFGPERCFDTPLSEDGIVGTAIGMAVNGLRPVAEIQFQDFIFPAFDQIVSDLTILVTMTLSKDVFVVGNEPCTKRNDSRLLNPAPKLKV